MDDEKKKLLQDIFGDENDLELSELATHETLADELIKDLETQFEGQVTRLLQHEQDSTKGSKRRSGDSTRKNKRNQKNTRATRQKKQQQVGDANGAGEADEESEASIVSDDEPVSKSQRRKNTDFPEFDELLEPLKAQRMVQRRRAYRAEDADEDVDLGNESDVDENASSLIKSMREAAEQDVELNRRKLPAIKKVKLLSEVSEQLNRRDLHLYFLDAGVLDAVRSWLEPLPDGSLPSFDICRTMLKFLEIMPIDRDHLKESGVGKVVMFLYKHPKENAENRRLCETLINKWSRPIFGLRSNYSMSARAQRKNKGDIDDEDDDEEDDGGEENRNKQDGTRKNMGLDNGTTITSPTTKRRRSSGFVPETKDDASVLKKRPGEAGFSWHAHIPQPATFDYLIKPTSSVSNASSKGHHSKDRSSTPDAFKKLNQKMRARR